MSEGMLRHVADVSEQCASDGMIIDL